MLAIVSADGVLMGVVTDWDITKASATACAADVPVAEIMSREVITARPDDNAIDVVRKLETHEISAMPVVDKGAVVGVVSTDILAHKTLYRILQAQA
jgi:CBS domain-containing protein